MNPDAVERKLAAIMFTDIVGYTVLHAKSEEQGLRVREQQGEILRPRVEQYGGEWISHVGDETLSSFPSAVAAVNCALAIQKALRDEPELSVRIGIHVGDVVQMEGSLHGDGVNIAARIRPLAEPGGICISEEVQYAIRSQENIEAVPLGEHDLKNVGRPVSVFRVQGTPSAPSPAKRRPDTQALKRRGRSHRRLAWAGAAALLAVGLLWLVRGPILVWVVLNLPRLLGASVEQQIAFAETSDGVHIAYATSGAGPPIVFVLGWASHLTEGLGSPLYDQSGYLSWYSRDHLVVRYDGRGFGLSDRDVTDFSLDARVRDVEAVVDALGAERFALYALSTGGPIGVAYAVRHPDRVSHLVLAATWASTNTERSRMIRDLFEFVGANWETPAARASLVEFLAPEASDVERRLLMHFLRVAGDGPQFQGFIRFRLDIDVTEQARRIRIPTLVVASDADTTVVLPDSRRLASLIPGARFEIIEGAGHRGAAFDDPRVMRLVSDFLAKDASGAQ